MNQLRFNEGRIPIQDLEQNRYAYLTAQIRLAEAKRKVGRAR